MTSLIDSIWFAIRTVQGLILAFMKLGSTAGMIVTIIITQEFVDMVHPYL